MKDLRGKVAVITGAAEGIGKAISIRAAKEGMKLVLADLNAPKLEEVARVVNDDGGKAVAMKVDVSQADQVEALAKFAYSSFGSVHLLVNNAGVGLVKSAWETTHKDWEFVMGVNLFGVTNGIRSFIPRMLAGGEPGHVVNTASIAGMISAPSMAVYNASKFGVVTLSEGLYHDLTLRKAKISVSVLCPGWVKTGIAKEEDFDPKAVDRVTADNALLMARAVREGIQPEEVAEAVITAVRENRFYIITHPRFLDGIRTRMDDILKGRQPTLLPFV